MQWKPQQWWAGQDAFIIGGGPSLREFDWRRLIPFLTVGCNDAYQLGPSVCTICMFSDLNWYQQHLKRGIKEFPNPVITNQSSLHESEIENVLTMERSSNGPSRTALGWGGNTGYSAINLALILGARRVFLLGFDMKRVKRKTNWHDQNVGVPNDASYHRFIQGFEQSVELFAKVFPEREIINITPDSELNVFPKADLDDYIPVCADVSEEREMACV